MVALGLICLVVAAALVLAEAHLSTGGLMAAVAVVSLVCGVGLLLIGATVGVPAVLAVSGGVCVVSVGGLVLLIRSIGPVGRGRPQSGSQTMVGHIGTMRAGDRSALVYVDGGLWRAQPSPLDEEDALHDGDLVVIERVKGLTLYVRKAEQLELNS